MRWLSCQKHRRDSGRSRYARCRHNKDCRTLAVRTCYVSHTLPRRSVLGHDCFEQEQLCRGRPRILLTTPTSPTHELTMREDCCTFPSVKGCRGQNRDSVTGALQYLIKCWSRDKALEPNVAFNCNALQCFLGSIDSQYSMIDFGSAILVLSARWHHWSRSIVAIKLSCLLHVTECL